MAEVAGYVSPGTPPKVGVPGPYQEPAVIPPYQRPVNQPRWRVVQVPVNTNLTELAMRYYSNPSEWTRILADNRAGDRMPDGSSGAVNDPNSTILAGTRIWLSN